MTIRDTINIREATNMEITSNNISTSIRDLPTNDAIAEVYPNPATNQLFIKKWSTYPATIQLFDITGKLLKEQTTEAETTSQSVEGLKGMYLLKITDGFHRTTKKITTQ